MPETMCKYLASYLINTEHRYSHNTNINVAIVWITRLRTGSWHKQCHPDHAKVSGCLNKHISHVCFIKLILLIFNPEVNNSSSIGKDMEKYKIHLLDGITSEKETLCVNSLERGEEILLERDKFLRNRFPVFDKLLPLVK